MFKFEIENINESFEEPETEKAKPERPPLVIAIPAHVCECKHCGKRDVFGGTDSEEPLYTCGRCGDRHPAENFGPRKTKGSLRPSSICKPCRRETSRLSSAAGRERKRVALTEMTEEEKAEE